MLYMVDSITQRDYLTVQQAARYLGVSSQTLRRWDSDGKLNSVRHPGNQYRYYKRSDLEPLRLEYKRAEQLNPGSFFQSAIADIETNLRLREPQREAHKAVREHFEKSQSSAIVQIPVGCGKTGIIATLPFGVSTGRVLVVAPNTTIRTGVAEALEVGHPKFFLGKTKVIESFAQGPFAAVLDGPQANVHDCSESHYVVTNIHQLVSSADRWLPQLPPNFFDMILVDEGHHNVAESWQKVFDRFPQAKVVSLTATPFRSDGRRVRGEVIYRYTYAKAMLVGYIKQIHSINVAPSEIFFTYKGDQHRHTLSEVMMLREEAWFRRGVALAPECNRGIVDASIQRMHELRTQTGQKQQIIAAACSIDHARQIRRLYEQRGLRAHEVYSEMDAQTRARVMSDLEEMRIDCIVQVQMLGEGFDHPPLSVAAIFRPFRSLSPYVQFVGRVMRVMFQDDPTNPANHGYVVSHIGLNNDTNWRDFRDFDLEDQEVFREWLEAKENSDPLGEDTGSGHGRSRRFDGDMLVHGELISEFVRQSFLDPSDDRIIDKILDAVVPGVGVPFRSFMSREQARHMLSKAQERMLQGEPQAIPVTPQRRRQAARKRIADRTKSVAARVLTDLGLSVSGFEVGQAMSAGRGSRNLAAVIRLLNRQINEHLGISNDQRGQPPAADLEVIVNEFDTIGDSVKKSIEEARRNATD